MNTNLTVAQNIALGNLDDQLDDILGELRYRQSQIKQQNARQVAATLMVNDRVKIRMDAPLKPRYLRGVALVVEKVNVTRAVCRVENQNDLPSGSRFTSGIQVPLAYVEAA